MEIKPKSNVKHIALSHWLTHNQNHAKSLSVPAQVDLEEKTRNANNVSYVIGR